MHYRQMRNKQFTRDVIDTLGHRLLEVVLPIPADVRHRELITSTVGRLLRARGELRAEARRLRLEVEAA
jgi:type I restriction enzyme M protein